MQRTAQKIEEAKEVKASVSTEPKKNRKGNGRGMHPNSIKNMRPKPWPKGVSGNPGGKPGTDLAALAARGFFEAHPEGIEGLQVPKGFNAYAFSVLADRGYGKLKEKQEVNLTVDIAGIISRVRKRLEDASKR